MTYIYTIKEITEKTGLSGHTLRFYEKEGLLRPERDKNGRRSYDEVHLNWIIFICKMRNSHMSISKIRAYQEFYLQGDKAIKERRELLLEHLQNIQSEIENLKRVEMFLTDKLSMFDKKHSTLK